MYKNMFMFLSSWCADASQLKIKKPAEDMIDEPLTVSRESAYLCGSVREASSDFMSTAREEQQPP